MEDLGKFKTLPLRDVWKWESSFTRWLADNLQEFGREALGMELVLVAREQPVGAFPAPS